jgi:protein-L-isoaspartate(D-aspartate) O-methyltransferase
MEYKTLRKKMVYEQLLARGIKNQRVLDAFNKVERERFVPEELSSSAYSDFPIPIGEGQTISQPYIVALMVEALDLSGSERVLEVGTGSGYQTAILAELSKQVYSIERIESLAKRAGERLVDYKNIKIQIADGSLGWPEEAPFEKIIISAASPRIPLPLTEQLSNNGKLILPIGEQFNQVLTLVEKKNNQLISTGICGCIFVPLVGKYAFKN